MVMFELSGLQSGSQVFQSWPSQTTESREWTKGCGPVGAELCTRVKIAVKTPPFSDSAAILPAGPKLLSLVRVFFWHRIRLPPLANCHNDAVMPWKEIQHRKGAQDLVLQIRCLLGAAISTTLCSDLLSLKIQAPHPKRSYNPMG